MFTQIQSIFLLFVLVPCLYPTSTIYIFQNPSTNQKPITVFFLQHNAFQTKSYNLLQNIKLQPIYKIKFFAKQIFNTKLQIWNVL